MMGLEPFSYWEARMAMREWGFNCGPAAICAILDKSPDQIRPFLGSFEEKGYMNPTMMYQALGRLRVRYKQVYRNDDPGPFPKSDNALVRIQFGGPWTNPGVPMVARYVHTHWIAVRQEGRRVFDVNAIKEGGWIKVIDWEKRLIPWLCEEACPRWDGRMWATHVLEVVE